MTASSSIPRSYVTRLASELVSINTSNPTHCEKAAADVVADALHRIGVDVQWFEPEPGRCSVVGRVAGEQPDLPPLLVHGHLDVVPAVDAEWTVDPFGGEIRDGYVWGRGTIDMKGQVASVIAAVDEIWRGG